MHELVLSASLATHFAPHHFGFNVPEDFPKVARLVPTLDVAEPALDDHKLPNLMGIFERPCAAALSSSTSIGHDGKLGTHSSPSQFVLDIFVPFLFTIHTRPRRR